MLTIGFKCNFKLEPSLTIYSNQSGTLVEFMTKQRFVRVIQLHSGMGKLFHGFCRTVPKLH